MEDHITARAAGIVSTLIQLGDRWWNHPDRAGQVDPALRIFVLRESAVTAAPDGRDTLVEA